MEIADIIDIERYPVGNADFGEEAKLSLDDAGVLVLEGFIRPHALAMMQSEAAAGQGRAYFCTQSHSVYLTPPNPDFGDSHPANQKVESSKGCICDDMVSIASPLRILYNHPAFRDFIKQATGETELHPYADPLSSINIHYANRGQELGWHFDNSSFAITLLIQKPDQGSHFEYVKDLRDADAGDMNYDGVAAVLDGTLRPKMLDITPGTLVLFRGRDSLHRVSPNESDKTRMLAVLAYNSQPGVELSESARMTFYGRLA
ncbi:2OG-Fe(II) oxygenase [Lutimaribacter marinistellae]|uniref:2OG-Fe(II) oxygenase n=1 Tax=Lutimaribacter marinistellae TaxID=1820329 RepID=A0ABV7TQ72_9RHOB